MIAERRTSDRDGVLEALLTPGNTPLTGPSAMPDRATGNDGPPLT